MAWPSYSFFECYNLQTLLSGRNDVGEMEGCCCGHPLQAFSKKGAIHG